MNNTVENRLVGYDDDKLQEFKSILSSKNTSIDARKYIAKHIFNENLECDEIKSMTSEFSEIITVIITSYNRKQYIEQAVDSVLKQDYPSIKIVIMDDCSDDGTQDFVMSKYGNNDKVLYHRNKVNMGPGYNRKEAYKNYVAGKYVVFMDDDDFFINYSYFTKVMGVMKLYPEVAYVAGNNLVYYSVSKHYDYFKLNNYGLIRQEEYFLEFNSEKYNKPGQSFVIFNKECLEMSCASEMKILNDTTIFLRAALSGPPYLLDDYVGVVRVHGGNISFACTLDFIIDNLEEKYKVRKMAINRYTKEQLEQWYKNQIIVTTNYYILNSKPHISDCLRLIKWIWSKAPTVKRFVIKRCIKSVLRYLVRKD